MSKIDGELWKVPLPRTSGNPTTSEAISDRQKKRVLHSKVKNGEAPSNVREIDFSKYPQRRIALLFLYTGWDHDGLVTQVDTDNTVEQHIFSTLLHTRLIKSVESAQWTRCGRTDKGVSAFRQVGAVTVRSTDVNAADIFWHEDSDPSKRIKTTQELPFVKMLNGRLPKSIRVLAWCPAPDKEFSARWSCTDRTYTYVLPRGTINTERMNNACQLLIGSHDFRNLCHIDRNKARLGMSYIRTIISAKAELVEAFSDNNPYALLRLNVKASGFLWHQIRCIVTLLYEIGNGREEPEIITQLLDISSYPARPQYPLANELPLCLFDCSYPDGNLNWIYDYQILSEVLCDLQRKWAEHQVKANILRAMVGAVCGICDTVDEQKSNSFRTNTQGLETFIIGQPFTKRYTPILKRPLCRSLEERQKEEDRKKSK